MIRSIDLQIFNETVLKHNHYSIKTLYIIMISRFTSTGIIGLFQGNSKPKPPFSLMAKLVIHSSSLSAIEFPFLILKYTYITSFMNLDTFGPYPNLISPYLSIRSAPFVSKLGATEPLNSKGLQQLLLFFSLVVQLQQSKCSNHNIK